MCNIICTKTVLICVHNCCCANLVQVVSYDGQLALSDLTHRDGLLTGSTHLDVLFEQYVEELFGKEQIEEICRQHHSVLTKIKLESWQDAKKTFNGSRNATVQLPIEIANALPVEVCWGHNRP